MTDQRSLTDQLIDLAAMAVRSGMYDAADFIRRVVPAVRQASAYRECQECGFEWYEDDPSTPEQRRSTCSMDRRPPSDPPGTTTVSSEVFDALMEDQ